jgi:hypothetical protein
MSWLLIQYEQLIENYNVLKSILENHNLIFMWKIPYGYRDEFTMNKALINYVDSSIKILFYLKDGIGIDLQFKQQSFEHNLLRKYRNYNQHDSYFGITPRKRSDNTTNYYIWPEFHNFDSLPKGKWYTERNIKDEFPDWLNTNNDKRDLSEFIDTHQADLLKLLTPVIDIVQSKIEFRKEYPIAPIGGWGW